MSSAPNVSASSVTPNSEHTSGSTLVTSSASFSRSSDKRDRSIAKKRRGSRGHNANEDGATREPSKTTRSESLGGAIIRSLFGTLAFLFKRPVRLFRPVKLSSWTILEAMAKREGRTLSLRYLRSLIRRENSSFLPHLLLPPLLFNTAIGFTLFEAYSITESKLLSSRQRRREEKANNSQGQTPPSQTGLAKRDSSEQTQWTPLWIVTLSGAVAGAAQCFLSAPLDNVRYVIQQQRNMDASSSSASPTSTKLSWRSILRAAILPFAPALTRDRLVQRVADDTLRNSQQRAKNKSILSTIADVRQRISSSSASQIATQTASLNNSMQNKPLISKETRKEWERRLKRWRGGVHGSGLVLSLIRDSVGFGSFFCIFEISRRCAFFASTSVDRVSAWINARGLGISLPGSSGEDGKNQSNVVGRRPVDDPVRQGGEHDAHIEDSGRRWNRHGDNDDADVSYNTSRTVQGRVVAVVILLIGGAVGALSYELVGRPFELMRVVIWEGRKQWEMGKREPGATGKSSTTATTSKHRYAHKPSSTTIQGRTMITGSRSHPAHASVIRRIPSFKSLRTQSRLGTNDTRVFAAFAGLSRARHPLRRSSSHRTSHLSATSAQPDRAEGSTTLTSSHSDRTSHTTSPSGERKAGVGRHASTKRSLSPPRPGAASTQKHYPTPTLATRPSFLTLLIEHAQRTYAEDRKYEPAPAPSSSPSSSSSFHRSTAIKDRSTSLPLLLLHTYFIAPFVLDLPTVLVDNSLTRKATLENSNSANLKSNTPKSTTMHDAPKTTTSTSMAAAPFQFAKEKLSSIAQKSVLLSLATKTRQNVLARKSFSSPESKVRRNWTDRNPVNVSFLQQTQHDIAGSGGKREGTGGRHTHRSTSGILTRLRMKDGSGASAAAGGGGGSNHATVLQKGSRFWASGRVGWALRRLATPYGVAFLVFAWLGGDLN